MKQLLCGLLLLCLAGLTACGGEIQASKKPFPALAGTDMAGSPVDNSLFEGYDATIVNFWNNSCGTCIEEMPELETLYQELKDRGVNVIGIGADAGESEDKLEFARNILSEKGVTYLNIALDPDSDLYKVFLQDITGYPTTFVVDREGNIIGNSIVGNVKRQEDVLYKRLDLIQKEK